MIDETILEKIRKLNAKAQDNSVTEEEAALYAQKVAELLQRHNLTEAALAVEDRLNDPVTEDRMQNGKTNDPWAKSLASVVAELYFCDVYLRSLNGKTKICFVGKPHNIEIAMSMTDYLIKTIGRLASAYANSPDAKMDFNWTFTRARNGFERGAGGRLYWRIRDMIRAQNREAPQRSASGNPANLPALYQDEKKLVDVYLKSLGLRAGRGRGSDTSGNHAARGRAAADGISLGAQVGSKSRHLLG